MGRSWSGCVLGALLLPIGGCVALSDADLVFRTGKPTGGDDSALAPIDSGAPPPDDSGPVDADGDGYSEGEDCDDAVAAVNPGADEVCDGLDNNCDGVTDEDAIDQSTWYPDADADGYGDGATPVTSCGGDGLVDLGGDCDDADSASWDTCGTPRSGPVSLATDDGISLLHGDDVADDNAYIGAAVAAGGDWDGDGVGDVVVGASGSSAWYVVTGRPSEDVYLSPDGAGGDVLYTYSGDVGESAGVSAGLFDGWEAEGAVVAAGASSANGLRGEIALLSADGGVDATLSWSGTDGDGAGYALANAGDVNGDELDDLLVGSYEGRRAWLLFGPVAGGALPTASSSGAQVWASDELYFGRLIGAPGDVDGDGFSDVLLGVGSTLKAYLILGDDRTEEHEIPDLSGAFAYGQATTAYWTQPSLSPAGDLNADGYADFLIATPGLPDDTTMSGTAWVVYGQQDTTEDPFPECPTNLDDCAGATLHGASGDYLGYWYGIRGVGDLDGDHIDDLVVGAPGSIYGYDSSPAGTVYVVYGVGSEGGFSGSDTIAHAADLTFVGSEPGDQTGSEMAFVPDTDGDGCDELLLGAPHIEGTDATDHAGKAWLVSGCTD